jgi:hypothetical protein
MFDFKGEGGGESSIFSSGDESSLCPSLTYTQRLWGFGICFVLGWVISFLVWIDMLRGTVIVLFECVPVNLSSAFLCGVLPIRLILSDVNPT